MDFKTLPLHSAQFKAKGDQGLVEGWASTFGGSPDSFDDIVVSGAFADSLKVRTPKFLWQHDMSTPIGKTLSLEETDHGLYGRWQLAKTKAAQDAYELIKDELVDGLSIGFQARESAYNQDGTRLLQKIDLFEVSAVTVGANPSALITSVKVDTPFHLLLKQVLHAVSLAAREAQALADRREADGRSLNDRHIAAIEALLPEAKALVAALTGLRVVTSDAEAEVLEMQLRLKLARARLALRRPA